MNRDRARTLLPIIQAFADGKYVQYKEESGKWFTLDEPVFRGTEEYRIKPEPREFTVCLCKRYQPFKIQEMKCNDCEGYGNCEVIKVREVLDDE